MSLMCAMTWVGGGVLAELDHAAHSSAASPGRHALDVDASSTRCAIRLQPLGCSRTTALQFEQRRARRRTRSSASPESSAIRVDRSRRALAEGVEQPHPRAGRVDRRSRSAATARLGRSRASRELGAERTSSAISSAFGHADRRRTRAAAGGIRPMPRSSPDRARHRADARGSAAWPAVLSEPERQPASTTTVARLAAAISRLRCRNRHFVGAVPRRHLGRPRRRVRRSG